MFKDTIDGGGDLEIASNIEMVGSCCRVLWFATEEGFSNVFPSNINIIKIYIRSKVRI